MDLVLILSNLNWNWRVTCQLTLRSKLFSLKKNSSKIQVPVLESSPGFSSDLIKNSVLILDSILVWFWVIGIDNSNQPNRVIARHWFLPWYRCSASPGLWLLFSLFHTLISCNVPTCCMKSHRFIILITLLSVLTHGVKSFHSIRSALWGGGVGGSSLDCTNHFHRNFWAVGGSGET
jgi:hypothetical protein